MSESNLIFIIVLAGIIILVLKSMQSSNRIKGLETIPKYNKSLFVNVNSDIALRQVINYGNSHNFKIGSLDEINKRVVLEISTMNEINSYSVFVNEVEGKSNIRIGTGYVWGVDSKLEKFLQGLKAHFYSLGYNIESSEK